MATIRHVTSLLAKGQTKIKSRRIIQQNYLRAVHYFQNLQPRRNDQLTSCQKRSIWPFALELREKAASDEVSIQMPKKCVEEERESEYHGETQDILNSPIGTLGESTWLRAERIIEQFSEKEEFLQAFRLLDRLSLEPDANIKLKNDSIYFVIQKWLTASQQQKRILYPVFNIWKRIEGYENADIPLESRTYHRIIEGLAIGKYKKRINHQGPVGPELAETILERMMELSKLDNPDVRPSTYTFNAVLVAWDHAASTSLWAKAEAPHRTLALLKRLKLLYETGWGLDYLPDKNTYRRVMNVFAHNGDGDQVEALLEELYECYLDSGNLENLLPTTNFFSLVLYAWSKSKDPMAADRALVILEKMLDLESSGEIPGLQVTAACFNIVMVCFDRQRTKESAMQVQSLFDRLVELSKNDPVKKPVGGSYTVLISALSHFDAPKADAIFWHWKEEHDKGICEMRMDSKLLGILVAGWYNSENTSDCAERCDRLLKYALDADLKSFEPSVVVFNMTINAYCRKKTVEGVERAEALLRQMEDYEEKLTPSVFSYVPIIHAWAFLGRVERAEEFLLEWYRTSSRTKKARDSPSLKTKKRLDTQTFNHVLAAWLSKVKENPMAATRAENLLLSMHELGVQPNAFSFQQVLECRKVARRKSKEEHSGSSRIEEILSFLDAEYKNGARINDESYRKLRKAWSLMSI